MRKKPKNKKSSKKQELNQRFLGEAQDIIDEVIKEKFVFKKQPIKAKITKEELSKLKEIDKKELSKPKKETINKVKKLNLKIPKIKFKIPLDKDDAKVIRKVFFYVLFFGVSLNFAVFVIFDIPFTFYSWFGWGFALWLIENKLVRIIKSLISK